MLNGMPFLLCGIRLRNGLDHQLLEAWSQFGNHFHAPIAENLFVIDFDDSVILALRSVLDVDDERERRDERPEGGAHRREEEQAKAA